MSRAREFRGVRGSPGFGGGRKARGRTAAARLRWRRRWPWLAAAPLLVLLVLADRAGCLLARGGDDLRTYHGTRAAVAAVIDGDTLEIDIRDLRQGRSLTRVRLWGVDCPEGAGPGRAAEPLAAEATAFVQSAADGREVVLQLEPARTRDPYGRLIAHVELPDGSSLNEALLAAGLARADERWPHALLDRYAAAQRAARLERRGIWAQE